MNGRRGITHRTGALTLAGAIIGALLVFASPASAACAGPVADGELRAVEQQLFSAVNRERSAPLAGHPELTSIARQHAARMAAEGRIYHNPGFLGNIGGLGAQALGENVGKGCSADQLHAAFMVSPSHRGNIVNDVFTHAGFGAAADASGALYVVQAFGAFAPPPAAPAPVPASTAPDAQAPPPGRTEAVSAPAAPVPAPDPQPVAPEPAEAQATEPTGRSLTAAEWTALKDVGAVPAPPEPVVLATPAAPVANLDLVPPALAALVAAALATMMLRRRPKLAWEAAR